MTDLGNLNEIVPFFGNLGLGAFFFWLYWKTTEKMDKQRAEHKDEMKSLLLKTQKDTNIRDRRIQKTTDEFKNVVIETTKVNTEMTASMTANKEAIENLSHIVLKAIKQ